MLVTTLSHRVLLLNLIVIDVHPATTAHQMVEFHTLLILLMLLAGSTAVLLATTVVLVPQTPHKPRAVVGTTVQLALLLNFFARLVTISQALVNLLAWIAQQESIALVLTVSPLQHAQRVITAHSTPSLVMSIHALLALTVVQLALLNKVSAQLVLTVTTVSTRVNKP